MIAAIICQNVRRPIIRRDEMPGAGVVEQLSLKPVVFQSLPTVETFRDIARQGGKIVPVLHYDSGDRIRASLLLSPLAGRTVQEPLNDLRPELVVVSRPGPDRIRKCHLSNGASKLSIVWSLHLGSKSYVARRSSCCQRT